MSQKGYFISGIGTDVGKTVVSAVLTEALQADYWKPVQAGDLGNTDSMKVRALIQEERCVRFHEAYALNTPASPHHAADVDGIKIRLEDIQLPETTNRSIVEGAGGLMVPLNDEALIIDLAVQFKLEVILVVRHYLGSINHTLLSLEVLQSRGIPVKGIVISGAPNTSSEQAINMHSDVPILGHVSELESVTQDAVKEEARKWRKYNL